MERLKREKKRLAIQIMEILIDRFRLESILLAVKIRQALGMKGKVQEGDIQRKMTSLEPIIQIYQLIKKTSSIEHKICQLLITFYLKTRN